MNHFEKINNCYLIAEIGVNHNGDINLARKMIEKAKKAGADAVKFQSFSAKTLVSKGTPKVLYQKETTSQEESHYEMLKKLELNRKDFILIKDFSEKCDLDFISTPYDLESAKFLNNDLKVKIFKTASADLVDLPLQEYIAGTKKPTIVSVGMASLGEIEKVVNKFKQARNNHLVLLHCVSNYPCNYKSINLKVLKTLQQAFDLPVGYSDHSLGEEAAILSIAFNSKVIEKHFTLDKNLPGPDHRASSTPREFENLVTSIRRAEDILGSSVKKCQKEEFEMSKVSRKSIVIAKNLKKGELITKDYLTMKRPGTGLNAEFLGHVIGSYAKKNIQSNEILSLKMIEWK